MRQTISNYSLCLLFALSLLFTIALALPSVAQEQPQWKSRVEVRAVWLTTVFNLDWPKRAAHTAGDEMQQKRELEHMLDRLFAAGINTIYLQVRGRGELLYSSALEPQSPAINKRGSNRLLTYDPLAFAIEACHKRGMRVHAWLVTLPLGTSAYVRQLGTNAYALKHRNKCVLLQGEWYMDPAAPETAEHLAAITKELLLRYPLDGIHLDYIRYPGEKRTFPDKATYRRQGKGATLAQWRTDNINRIVSAVYEQSKTIRSDVEITAAPLGKLRALPSAPNAGWTAQETVHQDPMAWSQANHIDAVVPMMYYKDHLFYPYAEDWVKAMPTVPVIVGLGSYRMLPSEGDWSLADLAAQIGYAQKHPGISGVAFFRAEQLTNARLGLAKLLADSLFRSPALPLLRHSITEDSVALAPHTIQVDSISAGLQISWQTGSAGEASLYHIYIDTVGDGTTLVPVIRTLETKAVIPWALAPKETLVTFTVASYAPYTATEYRSREVHVYYHTPLTK